MLVPLQFPALNRGCCIRVCSRPVTLRPVTLRLATNVDVALLPCRRNKQVRVLIKSVSDLHHAKARFIRSFKGFCNFVVFLFFSVFAMAFSFFHWLGVRLTQGCQIQCWPPGSPELSPLSPPRIPSSCKQICIIWGYFSGHFLDHFSGHFQARIIQRSHYVDSACP